MLVDFLWDRRLQRPLQSVGLYGFPKTLRIFAQIGSPSVLSAGRIQNDLILCRPQNAHHLFFAFHFLTSDTLPHRDFPDCTQIFLLLCFSCFCAVLSLFVCSLILAVVLILVLIIEAFIETFDGICLALALDIDLESGQSCCQTCVLSFFTNGQRQLIIRYDSLGSLLFRICQYNDYFCRRCV